MDLIVDVENVGESLHYEKQGVVVVIITFKIWIFGLMSRDL